MRWYPDLGWVAIEFFTFEHVPHLSLVSSHDLCGVARQEDKIASMVYVLRVRTCYVLATSRIATLQIAAVIYLAIIYVDSLFLVPLWLNDPNISIVIQRLLCVMVDSLESGSILLMVLSTGLVLPG